MKIITTRDYCVRSHLQLWMRASSRNTTPTHTSGSYSTKSARPAANTSAPTSTLLNAGNIFMSVCLFIGLILFSKSITWNSAIGEHWDNNGRTMRRYSKRDIAFLIRISPYEITLWNSMKVDILLKFSTQVYAYDEILNRKRYQVLNSVSLFSHC